MPLEAEWPEYTCDLMALRLMRGSGAIGVKEWVGDGGIIYVYLDDTGHVSEMHFVAVRPQNLLDRLRRSLSF